MARPLVRNPFVVVANPDTLQLQPVVADALAFMAERPRVGILGPRIVSSDGSQYRSSWRDLTLPRLAAQSLTEHYPAVHAAACRLRLDGVGLQRSERAHRRSHPTEWISGAFMACRVEALEQVDWFDESIFLFGEDGDLCRRVRQVGWEVWYAPIGAVFHSGGHSRRQLPNEGRAFFHEARYRELHYVRGPLQAELYRYAQVLRSLFRILIGRNPETQRRGANSAVAAPYRSDMPESIAHDQHGVAP
jgi:N-acetylglucosaminyl-diphospho-decaprenol L-rhamnosyltransferase